MTYPEGPFDVVVVDPPWSYGSASSAGKPGAAEGQYHTIGSTEGTEVNRRTGAGVENIAACFPVDEIAGQTAALYLWTTNPKLPFAFDLMAMWGFTYKTLITWVKTRKDGDPMAGGMGWFYRGCTEHVLLGTRGGYAIPASLRRPNVVLDRRAGHSVKPDSFYRIVEATSPGQRRLDVFARKERLGWTVWGDEVAAV